MNHIKSKDTFQCIIAGLPDTGLQKNQRIYERYTPPVIKTRIILTIFLL